MPYEKDCGGKVFSQRTAQAETQQATSRLQASLQCWGARSGTSTLKHICSSARDRRGWADAPTGHRRKA